MSCNPSRARSSASTLAAAAAVAALIGSALTGPAPAGATIIDPVTPRQLAREAALVFEGEVVDVQYRLSEAGPGLDSLPHTFVTYQVGRLFKGDSEAGNLITLRFQGGLVPGTQEAMMVAAMPTFDVGDRDVLFVRDNGEVVCPLVGWGQGRFRIVDGAVYSDEGRVLFLGREDRFILGAARALPEVLTHRMGDVELGFAPPAEAARFTPPAGARRASEAAFAAAVERLIAMSAGSDELVALRPQPSADPDAPFQVAAAAPAAAPMVQPIAPTLRGEADPVEAQMVAEQVARPVQPVPGPKQPESDQR